MRRRVCCCVFFACMAGRLFAHEVRPAYLQLHQVSVDAYQVFWKVPALGENLRLSLSLEFPQNCARQTEPRGLFANGSYSEQWVLTCTGGLEGETVGVGGLSATLTDVIVRVEQ